MAVDITYYQLSYPAVYGSFLAALPVTKELTELFLSFFFRPSPPALHGPQSSPRGVRRPQEKR